MNTVFDALTLIIFAGLIVLFLERSIGEAPADDSIWNYLGAAVGCAVANYLGNQGYDIPAVVVIVATLMFIYYRLHPFVRAPKP